MAFAFIKVFGERNTSTNALSELLQQNGTAMLHPSQVDELGFGTRLIAAASRKLVRDQAKREKAIDAAFRRYGPLAAWKHCATRFGDVATFRDTLVVVCVRHPISWLLALHRRPYQSVGAVPDDFTEFLSMQWPTAERERLDGATLTPPQLYNAKLKSYLDLSAAMEADRQELHIVKFEDFATDQLAVFAGLANQIKGASAAPRPITKSTKDATKDAAFYKDYYGNNRWLADLSLAENEYANDMIDWDSAGRFGYARIAHAGAS